MKKYLQNTLLSLLAKGSEPANIDSNKWVNCMILWAKLSDGSVKCFIQPKLVPAWPEQSITHQHMHCGTSIFLFNCKFSSGQKCRFLSLVCFDWIGKTANNEAIYKHILKSLSEKYSENGVELHWIFVLQENRKPNDSSFLIPVKDFFEDRTTHSQVNRDYCAIFFTNGAGGNKAGKYDLHGCSSIIFSPNVSSFKVSGCPPTFYGNPTKHRGTDTLRTCSDILFRERGACIHSFSMRIPRFVGSGVQDKCLPLLEARVYSFDPSLTDPRLPGDSVASITKWIGDNIETIPYLGTRYSSAPLSTVSNSTQVNVAERFSKINSITLAKKMANALVSQQNTASENYPDSWDAANEDALKNLLETITIFEITDTSNINIDNPAHTYIQSDLLAGYLISIRGSTHEECLRYIEKTYVRPEQDFLILISRDDDNTNPAELDQKFTTAKSRSYLNGPPITNTSAGIINIGFNAILEKFRTSNDKDNLKAEIYELLR